MTVSINFWMQWITRKEPMEENWIQIFNTEFYTVLDDLGVDHVLKCTAKRKLDVFTKKMLILPINKQLHWSLHCVGNPSAVTYCSDVDAEDMEVSYMLFLDPLDHHNRSMVCDKVMFWLNAEWNRKHNNKICIFSPKTMKCFCPKAKIICTTLY
jgi:Ulp1 family protease